MNEAEFDLLDRIEEDHWWFVGKRLLLLALLGAEASRGRLLDLGCGTGGVLREWMARRSCAGVDRSSAALRICRRKGFAVVVQGDLSATPFLAGSFETVLALDVIEHMDDDLACLVEAARLCAPGGRLLVSVPAYSWMWSQHDETFEHRRRYSARQLERVVRSAGLVPERVTYTNALIFPIVAIWRLVSFRLGVGRFAPKHDFWRIPRWLNVMLVNVYRVEAWMLRLVRLPVGVSVACIARRPR